MPMTHQWDIADGNISVEYRWKHRDWNSISMTTRNTPDTIAPGSQEEFITEHYWGYTKIGAAKTAEYGVEHPRWEVYPAAQHYAINVAFGPLYGQEFEFLTHEKPVSVFLAEGSGITVKEGSRLPRSTQIA
jgi:hypothetical protein